MCKREALSFRRKPLEKHEGKAFKRKKTEKRKIHGSPPPPNQKKLVA